jgi:hypothetical protein
MKHYIPWLRLKSPQSIAEINVNPNEVFNAKIAEQQEEPAERILRFSTQQPLIPLRELSYILALSALRKLILSSF